MERVPFQDAQHQMFEEDPFHNNYTMTVYQKLKEVLFSKLVVPFLIVEVVPL